jgi:hypothetical protein
MEVYVYLRELSPALNSQLLEPNLWLVWHVIVEV